MKLILIDINFLFLFIVASTIVFGFFPKATELIKETWYFIGINLFIVIFAITYVITNLKPIIKNLKFYFRIPDENAATLEMAKHLLTCKFCLNKATIVMRIYMEEQRTLETFRSRKFKLALISLAAFVNHSLIQMIF